MGNNSRIGAPSTSISARRAISPATSSGLVCRNYKVDFVPEAVDYLLRHYYDGEPRSMDACHPRDLLEQILDYARFHGFPPLLTPENLDRVCRAYFVH